MTDERCPGGHEWVSGTHHGPHCSRCGLVRGRPEVRILGCGSGNHAWVIGTKHNYCTRCGLILEITGSRAKSPRFIARSKRSKNKVRRLRERVAERDGEECWWCIMPGTDDDPLTLEHVPRLARGGTWNLENLRLAHRSCNQDRPVLDNLEEA